MAMKKSMAGKIAAEAKSAPLKKAIAKKPAHMSEQFPNENRSFRGRSDLTRLSRVLGGYLEDSRMDHADQYDEGEAEDEFRMSHSIASPMRQRNSKFITDSIGEYDAEDMLREYRQNRDAGDTDESYSREDIREAYKNRADYTG